MLFMSVPCPSMNLGHFIIDALELYLTYCVSAMISLAPNSMLGSHQSDGIRSVLTR